MMEVKQCKMKCHLVPSGDSDSGSGSRLCDHYCSPKTKGCVTATVARKPKAVLLLL